MFIVPQMPITPVANLISAVPMKVFSAGRGAQRSIAIIRIFKYGILVLEIGRKCSRQGFILPKTTKEAICPLRRRRVQLNAPNIGIYQKRRISAKDCSIGIESAGSTQGKSAIRWRCSSDKVYYNFVGCIVQMASKKPKREASSSQRSTPPKPQNNYSADIASFYSNKINYSLLGHPPVTKTIRSFRQELNYLAYPELKGEFIAYCIVSKQSKSGVFSNERLLVLDSHKKELSYFSNVPTLPLTETAFNDTPKERIQIDKASKFSFTYVKNGIGEAIVGWEQGGSMHEWRLTLGNRRMAKQFAEIVESVKKDEHIAKKLGQSRTGDRKIEGETIDLSSQKVNRKETAFIQQLKKLEKEEMKKEEEKKGKERMRQDQPIVQEDYQSQLPTKREMKEAEEKEKSVEQSPPSVKSWQSSQSRKSKLETNSKTINLTIEIPTVPIVNEEQKIRAEVQPITPKLYEKQLPIEQILLNADKQYEESKKNMFLPLQEASLDRQTKNISELEKALKNRREGLQSSTAKRLTSREAALSSSKVTVKRIDSLSKEKPVRLEDAYSSVRPHSQYNPDVIRASLLEERRHTLNPAVNSMKKQNGAQIQPRRESVRSKTETSSQAVPSGPRWLYRWLTAKDNLCRAMLYSQFIDFCIERVKKIGESFQKWSTLHRKADPIVFQQEGVQYSYILLSNPLAESKEREYQYCMSNYDLMLQKTVELSSDAVQARDFQPSGPLACLITYQSIQVFCQTVVTPDLHPQILPATPQTSKYINFLSDSFRLLLQPSSFIQLQNGSSKWVYLAQPNLLPWVDKDSQQYIDGNFIKEYIKQGVISMEKDRETVAAYVKIVMGKTVKSLEKERLLSSAQLSEILKEKGLNSSFLNALCGQASQRQLKQAERLLLSEIISDIIVYLVRFNVQQYLLTRTSGKLNILSKVYETIDGWLRKDPKMIAAISQKLTPSLLAADPFCKLNLEYVATTVLFKLGLRCDIKRCPSLDTLQRLDYSFWSSLQFTPDQINLAFTHSVQHFNCRILNKDSPKLQRILLKDQEPGKEDDIFKMIAATKQIYTASPHFKLMPVEHQIAFCAAVANRTPPPTPIRIPPAYDFELSLYFNLLYHSTAFLLTARCLTYDLTGIRWLIKEKQLLQAKAKLREQLCRAWIWGRQCPKLLLEVVELQTMFSLLVKNEADSLASSLKSVQIAIACMEGEAGWELVCSKAHQAATLHYQLNRFEQALPLFRTCAELAGQTNEPIYPEIYRRIAEISLAQGSIESCFTECEGNLKRYSLWLSGECLICSTVETEMFETYLLQFRCLDIQNRKIDKFNLAEECCRLYVNPSPKQKVSKSANKQEGEYRVLETIKLAWQAMNDLLHCPAPSSTHYLHIHYPKVSISRPSIEALLLRYRSHQRYSRLEMVDYLRRMKRGVVSALMDCLAGGEGSSNSSSIYDEKENHGLVLECVCGLMGVDLALGYLQASTRDYSFSAALP